MPLTYIALGDSYTIGEWVSQDERWPDMLVERLKREWIALDLTLNPSVTGYTTEDLIRYELPLLEQYKPDFITLQIGVNDYFQWVPLASFRTRYIRVLSEIRRLSPQARILIVDIPDYGSTPYGTTTGNPWAIRKGIAEYNDAIRDIAESFSIQVVDVFTPSLRVMTESGLVASDGLHPSAEQYRLWVDVIEGEATKLIRP